MKDLPQFLEFVLIQTDIKPEIAISKIVFENMWKYKMKSNTKAFNSANTNCVAQLNWKIFPKWIKCCWWQPAHLVKDNDKLKPMTKYKLNNMNNWLI